MAPRDNSKRPIIVKRKAAHHDEHNGQWKVAYADFVTAMMAFFLIMWLLSSATSDDRQIIAKYFTSTSLFDLPAGNGVLSGSKSVLDGADAKPVHGAMNATTTQAKSDKGHDAKSGESKTASRDRVERQRFEAVKADLEQKMVAGELRAVAANLDVQVTSEGLRIQIFDRDGEAMFGAGSSDPVPRLKQILTVVAEVLKTVQNNVILSGHTDAQPFQRGNYSNMELSADRANSVRRTLEADGLPPGRVVRVEGRAAFDPLLPESPLDPRNRRISITIMRTDADPPTGASHQP